jgi:hemerythrin
MLKEWSDDFLIGIDEIDKQHRAFFDAAHRLYESILNCEGETAVEESVEFLKRYATTHFQTEEAFMLKHGYAQLEEHKRLHADFFDRLDLLAEDVKVFGPTQHLADQALEIAQDWLIDHIADEDSQYAKHVKKSD